MKLAVSAIILIVLAFEGPCTEAHNVRVGRKSDGNNVKKERAGHKHHVSPKKTERTHHHVESRCTDDSVWFDSYDDNCAAYAEEPDWCTEYPDETGTNSLGQTVTVVVACCATCKGSSGGGSDPVPAPTDPPVAAPVASGSVAEAWVTAHNKRRTQYGKPAASWNTDLAEQAKAWAEYLVSRAQPVPDECDTFHISDECDFGIGENIHTNSGSPVLVPDSPETVVNDWTEEEMILVPTHGQDQAGHATQVLWKFSTSIGCHTAVGACGAISVCRYYQAGNHNCDKCVDVIMAGTEYVDDEPDPLPVTSAVETCNKNTLSDYN